jgi:hypothetical protein
VRSRRFITRYVHVQLPLRPLKPLRIETDQNQSAFAVYSGQDEKTKEPLGYPVARTTMKNVQAFFRLCANLHTPPIRLEEYINLIALPTEFVVLLMEFLQYNQPCLTPPSTFVCVTSITESAGAYLWKVDVRNNNRVKRGGSVLGRVAGVPTGVVLVLRIAAGLPGGGVFGDIDTLLLRGRGCRLRSCTVHIASVFICPSESDKLKGKLLPRRVGD